MKINNCITYLFNIILIFINFLFINCGDIPLFDELATNRIRVILKGTYESNNPRPWWDYSTPIDTDLEDDSVDDCIGAYTTESIPSKFMLDIAEIKVLDISKKHKQKFANYRKTFTFDIDIEGDEDPYFNGIGVDYKNDDVRPDFQWSYIRIYIRKMAFDSAEEYYLENDNDSFNGNGLWTYNDNLEFLFHEKFKSGFDFNQLQLNTYYDSLLIESNSINRVFPLEIAIEDGFIFDNSYDETILEIRFFIKNFIKKYEYDYSKKTNDSDNFYNHYIRHYYALSDWLRDVKSDENFIGGNIITTVRSYIVGKTASLTGSAPSNNYIIAIPATHNITEYEIDDTSRDRPDCDEPKSPDLYLHNDFVSTLDYYLKKEKYNELYNNFVDCVNNESHENDWDEYNAKLEDFKLPQLATWVGNSGIYKLTDIPIGKTYHLYYSTGSNIGELPNNFVDTEIVISITDEMAGKTIIQNI